MLYLSNIKQYQRNTSKSHSKVLAPRVFSLNITLAINRSSEETVSVITINSLSYAFENSICCCQPKAAAHNIEKTRMANHLILTFNFSSPCLLVMINIRDIHISIMPIHDSMDSLSPTISPCPIVIRTP